MNKEKIILGLKDLIGDRESFITDNDEDNIFVQDKKILEEAVNYIENSIPISVVEEKIEEVDKLIAEAKKECGSASKEYTIYVYQKSILQELLQEKGEK